MIAARRFELLSKSRLQGAVVSHSKYFAKLIDKSRHQIVAIGNKPVNTTELDEFMICDYFTPSLKETLKSKEISVYR